MKLSEAIYRVREVRKDAFDASDAGDAVTVEALNILLGVGEFTLENGEDIDFGKTSR